MGQADQGTITGVVQDPSGAVIGGASVTLTSVDTGQVLKTKADNGGVYVFSPVKIGSYDVAASSQGFQTTQTNVHLSLQQRLNVAITLKPGATSETVTVTDEAPLMQTQESSVGQVMSTETINSVPLSGRNWVFVAQLAAGADPANGSRGSGRGDFNANGQRAEQNNFILDGVDNNANVVDFYNGASFVAQPPPDGLAEFKVQTSNYSAEFGHSAGAVVNASLKSGTNQLHGSAWEYLRNTALDATDWNLTKPANYHENQFGGTLGGPIVRNKLFFFGDWQANRIKYGETSIMSVPTAKERVGDLSELLQPGLTGSAAPVQLYYQDPVAGPQPFANNNLYSIGGVTPNATALQILNLYPQPNANNGKLYNNYYATRPAVDNTFQWDTRLDWNITLKDTAYSRFSYWNQVGYRTPPLGSVLDGGGFGDDGTQKNLGENFMLSETHIFTPTLTNEFRFGYNFMHTGFRQPNAANANYASSLGVGGIPMGMLNGGLPYVSISGLSSFGTPTWAPTDEHENVYQIIDNLTKIVGNHALKTGFSAQSIRVFTLQPQFSRGTYTYNGVFTSNLNAPNTGSAVADFLLDSQYQAQLSNEAETRDARWYYGAYFQDDWRVTQKFTLNLGVRWDYFQPNKELSNMQGTFNATGPCSIDTNLADPTVGLGTCSGQYLLPKAMQGYMNNVLNQTGGAFQQVLAMQNINLAYTSNPALVTAQKTNFAPRIGISYSPNQKFVIRAGYGIFFGGLESQGYAPNLGINYPFQYSGNFPYGGCNSTACTSDGITLGNGFSSIVANGFNNQVFGLFMRGTDLKIKTPYTQNYNLSMERSIGKDIVATVSYVGNSSRHLPVNPDPNAPLALENPGNWAQYARPFPAFGPDGYTAYAGMSNYNSLQTKIEKRISHGLSLFATYTWSHALDDAPPPLSTTDSGYRQTNLIPIKQDYSNSGFDTRHRITFNAYYQLPFGEGRQFLNQHGLVNALLGGWATNATFSWQTGNPFTVGLPSSFPLVAGAGSNYEPYPANAVMVGNPFAVGGTFQSPNPGNQVACASSTRNRQHWFNPCAFTYPWNPNDPSYEPQHYIPTGPSDPYYTGQPIFITDMRDAIGYIGGRRNTLYGPGYQRVNMSVFKDFKVYRENALEFRADIFNLFNHPSLGQPSSTLDNNAGLITSPRGGQILTPDARFIQLALKYSF
jgi:outer membrane receptor protein involved in Fe transport